jgi:hypothetical protein
MFREIISVYCESYKKGSSTMGDVNGVIRDVKSGGTCCYHSDFKG